jgi:K+-sensing histidine kinase KdpD
VVTGFVALVSDISEKKAFERFRSQAAARAERLLTITAGIAGAVSAEEVFEALVERVADAVGASSGALWLTDHDRGVARLMKSRGYTAAVQQRLAEMRLGQSPRIPALDCISSGEPVWISSQAELFERYPHLVSMATAGRAYRIACLPLVANQQTLGVLALTIEQGAELGTEEQEFLLLVSRYASQAIVRLRLLEAERSSRAAADAAAARLTVLGRSSRAFAESSLDLSSRLREIVAELARTLDSCVCVALSDGAGLLRLAAAQHPDPEALALLTQLASTAPLKMGEGITGATMATGESVLLGSVEAEQLRALAAQPYRAFFARHPAYALMSAALRVQGRVIGTVTTLRCNPGQTYSEEDLRLLEELGERAASAVENSRLYQETLDGKKRAEQLYRFAQAVVSAERVEEVFDAALTAIAASLGAERSAVLIGDRDGTMRFRAWRSLSESYRAAVEGHSPWPANAAHPEPLIVPDAEQSAELAAYRSLFRAERIGALAFFPLVTAGRLLGKFMVYYQEPHAFSAGEVETARAIANHLASVVTRFSVIAKLEETVRYNELFAGVLAHDLRNPLSAMITAAQLLLMQREGEGAKAEREAKPLSRILASGDRMRTMIEQLLDFTRARSGGGIVLEPQSVNLAELSAQAIGEIELAHPERRIAQELRGDPNGTWDSGRMLQVLSNLIANACQHGTPDAPVWVRIDGTAQRQVAVEVHNSGAIPAPLLGELFDPFRSTRHQRQRSRGLGLGLFIVREIVRAHGGSVAVTSTESKGTVFAIQLPRG